MNVLAFIDFLSPQLGDRYHQNYEFRLNQTKQSRFNFFVSRQHYHLGNEN